MPMPIAPGDYALMTRPHTDAVQVISDPFFGWIKVRLTGTETRLTVRTSDLEPLPAHTCAAPPGRTRTHLES